MKRFVSLAVSIALLALVYSVVDVRGIAGAIRGTDGFWLTLGLLMTVPLTMGTAWRLQGLAAGSRLGLGASLRLVLIASTLNLFLPSKMGDIAKAYAMRDQYGFEGGVALSITLLEKALDMISLLFWGVLALLWLGRDETTLLVFAFACGGLLLLLVAMIAPFDLLAPVRRAAASRDGGVAQIVARFLVTWQQLRTWFWSDAARARDAILLSVVIWAGHLSQFWLYARALGGDLPFADNMAYATLGILAGLLPLTMAGIGSRDAVLIHFYSRAMSPAAAAVLGILATLRYVLPALAGLPLLAAYRRSSKPATP